MTKKDKVALSRALAKALAFKAVGNDAEADRWAKVLIELLRDFHIVKGVSYS